MKQVGVRELNQNASAIVARVAAGESVTITYRGRAVAQLSPIREGNLASLIAAGGARLPKRSLSELTAPPQRSVLKRTSFPGSRFNPQGRTILTIFYFDTSAAVKLIIGEPESAALMAWVKTNSDRLVSSDLLRTELLRTTKRGAPEQMGRARIILESLTLVTLPSTTFERAAELAPDL